MPWAIGVFRKVGLSGGALSGRLAHTWCRGCATPICDRERRVAANRHGCARMSWTRGILAHWAQLGAFSSGNSRGRLKAVAAAVTGRRSRTTSRCRAFHWGHVAAQMEGLYNSLAGVPGLLTRRRGRVNLRMYPWRWGRFASATMVFSPMASAVTASHTTCSNSVVAS
jgi:hypothetical protein